MSFLRGSKKRSEHPAARKSKADSKLTAVTAPTQSVLRNPSTTSLAAAHKSNTFLLPWTCSSCTFSNKSSNKTCEMCSTARPPPTNLTIKVNLPAQLASAASTSDPAQSYLLFTSLQHNTTLGYLKDLLEAKTSIRFAAQLLLHGNATIEAEDDARIVDVIVQNPSDVYVLTLSSTDTLSNCASSSTLPAYNPPLKQQKSSSEAKFQEPIDEDLDFTLEDGDWDVSGGEEGWGEEGQEDEMLEPASPASSKSNTTAMSLTPINHKHKQSLSSPAASTTITSIDSSSRPAASKLVHIRRLLEIEQQMQCEIEELAEELALTQDEAAILLRAYRYHHQQLLDNYLSSPEQVRAKCGLAPMDATGADTKEETIDCGVCYDTVDSKCSCALACAHSFCRECFASWIVAECDKGPTAIKTTCPGYKCPVLIPSSMQAQFLPFDKKQKLHGWLLDDYVAAHKNLKFCPATNCRYVFEVNANATRVGGVECLCGHSLCFDCSADDHRPASCKDASTWQLKNSSESENVNWILANTKKCPKCDVHIEKNQGCNHMTCKKCAHEFCWLCKGDWKAHSNCAVYDQEKGGDSKASREEAAAAKARNELQRYMHYFSRFDNHAKSIRFAEKTRQTAQNRMEQLQKMRGAGLQEVQFLLDAVNSVIRCKRILQWTYVYAYYTASEGSARALFESHQQRLEEFCEKLHEMSEKPLESLLDVTSRTDLISFTRLCEKYRENVMNAIEASQSVGSMDE